MKVGDKLKLRPFINADSGMMAATPQDCVVTYIHPQRRYYVVEFTSERGEKFRQTMYFPEREGDMHRPMAKETQGVGARFQTTPKRKKK